MQYFGVPRCPYCNKRVNLIRTWSLKKQGEYKCPRCEGISNIFLSPLIYVFAVIAIFTGGAIFFFHRFVMDDVGLMTAVQVLLPFAFFFFLSLFTVYLKKPVINKAGKSNTKKRAQNSAPSPQNARRTPVAGERPPQRDMKPARRASQEQAARSRMFREDAPPTASSAGKPANRNPEQPVRRPRPAQPAGENAGTANGRRYAPQEEAGRRFAQNSEPPRQRRVPSENANNRED